MLSSRSLAINLLYRMLNLAVVFIFNVLLSRLAGPQNFGIITLLIANITLFNLISGFGSDAGITFNTASSGRMAKKMTTLISRIILVQLFILLMLEGLMFWTRGRFLMINTSNLNYLLLLAVYLVSVSVTEKYSALLNGRQQFLLLARILFLTNALNCLVVAWFFISGTSLGLKELLEIFVLLHAIQAISLLISANVGRVPTIISNAPSNFIRFSIFAFVINVIQFFAYRIDYWILAELRTGEELGVYSVAVKCGQMFWLLPNLIAAMLFPMVASGKDELIREKINSILRVITLFTFIGGAIVLITAPLLLPIVFGDEYGSAVTPLLILMPGIILFCAATILAAWYSGKDQLKVNFAGTVICFVVILILDILLIPEYGAEGAAIASSVGYGVTGIFYLVKYSLGERTSIGNITVIRKNDLGKIRSLLGFKTNL